MLVVSGLGLLSQRVLCVGWTDLCVPPPAARPGNCQCADRIATARLLSRRSGRSAWAADACCDRGLPTRPRTDRNGRDRSTNAGIDGNDLTKEFGKRSNGPDAALRHPERA